MLSSQLLRLRLRRHWITYAFNSEVIQPHLTASQVDEIAAVPGIDVLFIGPFDLANDIGHPIIGGMMHDELKAAFDRIYKAATDNGKWAGIYCNNGTEGHEYAQKGFHMVSIGADLVDIPSHFDNALCMARGEGVIG
ncbi:putative aldolase citrate lyase family protein [Lasiodiplodia theobromae]|nr:putative aldolase citrate lyase family protein [Lasiodiplodia theobromae]